MKKAGADLGAATAANKQFIADDRGNLTAAAADQALVYPEGAVDFVAYYPYTASVTENKVAVDVKEPDEASRHRPSLFKQRHQRDGFCQRR